MTLPTASQLYAVIDITWPPAAKHTVGPCLLRKGKQGGSRVSAATCHGPPDAAQLARAETEMRAMGQTPLFMIRDGDSALDALLATARYQIKDPVWIYTAPVTTLMTEPLRPVSTFRIWPPLQISRDIWAEGGVGPERIAIMTRADCPKTSLLGRIDDAPAAAAFVGIHNQFAMLHALEVRPEHRRKSMGGRMMRAAAFWAAEQGAETLSLLVTQANTGANALYSSLGMQRVGAYHYRIKPT